MNTEQMYHPYICTKCGTITASVGLHDTKFKVFPVKYEFFCHTCGMKTWSICSWQFEMKHYPTRFEKCFNSIQEMIGISNDPDDIAGNEIKGRLS
jgi:hypothetical protein